MDHYETLQIARGAEPEVVDKAYRALCMKYHPDHVAPERRAAATKRLQAINEAYSVLSDPARRAAYDRGLPDDRGRAWERFLDAGLYGLFSDWLETRR